MRKIYLLLLLVLAFEANAKCFLEKPHDVLTHIKNYHPEVVAQKAKIETYKESINKASQAPNPKIELKSMTPEGNFGSEGTSIGGEFKHIFELGNKKQARIKLAQGQLQQQEIRADEAIDHSLHMVVKTINQIHHLNFLIPLYEKGIMSFQKLLNRMDALPSKSPKETVGKTTLEMVIEDYKMRKSEIEVKKEELLSQMNFFIAEECSLAPSVFDNEATLTSLSKDTDHTFDQAASYKAAQNSVKIQERQLNLEKAKGWSNLEVGPSLEYTDRGFNSSREDLKVGIAVELQLPLFHTNEGGKAQARKGLKEQKIRFQNKRKQLRLNLKKLRNNYRNYKNKLQRLQKVTEIKKKKREVEDLFSRGTISTGLIIEAHRQLLNWHHQRFHLQQSALDVLWEINELTGQIKNANY